MFKRFTLGVAVGYVLGARAGQKRYEQITDLAERAMQLPWVERLADSGRTIAEDQGHRVLSSLRERARWIGEDSGDDGYDDEDDEYDDEPDNRGAQDEADGNYDEEDAGDSSEDDGDEGPYDEEGEGAYDEADEADEDEPDESDEDETDEEPEADTGRRSSRSRRAVGSVVSAARERGRVA